MPANSPTAPIQPSRPSGPASPEAEYILGAGEAESERLGLQHRIWAAQAHGLWERARLQPGQVVLDLGCGPGHAAMDMADLVGPGGRIIAVDESPLFLKHLHDKAAGRRLANIDRILGDVQQLDALLPQSQGTIDLAYARWVLCFVRDPESVVASVASLLKRGGRLAVQDYFNYESFALAPRRAIFTQVVGAIAASYRARGGDPDLVGRLPAMFRRHGLRLEHLALHHRIARPGDTAWHWPDSFFRNFLPRLVAIGHLSAAEHEQFEAAWTEAGADPDSFVMLPPVFDVVAVKE